MAAFEGVGGKHYLETVAKSDPRTFCTLLGKILPTQVAGDAEDGPVRRIEFFWLPPQSSGCCLRRGRRPLVREPADVYTPSRKPYAGLPELTYPFHDRDVLVTVCGRICIYRKKINLSIVLAGQRVGIKEVDDGIWIVSFMRYDLSYIDLKVRTLQPLDNSFGPRLSPMS